MNNTTTETDCELTILMPCLNEAETLAVCVDKARGFLQRTGVRGEVLVADNGSTDGSQEIGLAHGARVVDVSTRGGGYGSGLMGGILASKGKFIIMGDSDDSYDFTRLDAFVEQLRAGCDLVMGNRFQGGIEPGAMPGLHQYFGNPVLTWLGRRFFNSAVGDFNCGLRGFRKEVIEALDLQTIGMEFAAEMVVKATLKGVKVGEVPTRLSPDGRSRRPHLKSWQDGWRVLRFLLMYSPHWLFLYPGLSFIGLGLLSMALVLPGPLEIGSIVFDVHTLVVSMGAILVGTQLVIFFLLAKQFAVNERLLPAGPKYLEYRRYVSLEKAVLFGVVMFLVGTISVFYAIYLWGSAEFGNLDYSWMMRLVIPAVTLVAFGIQTVLAGFFSSILDIKLQRK